MLAAFLAIALLAATATAHWVDPNGAAFATDWGPSFGFEVAEQQTPKINALEQQCSLALDFPQIRCPLEHANEATLPLVPLRAGATAWAPTGRMRLADQPVAAAHGPPKHLS